LLGDRGEAEKFPQYKMVNMSVKYTPEQNKFIAQNMAPYVDYGVHPKGIFFMVLRKSTLLQTPKTRRNKQVT
jgi:hypothetical protein